MIDLSAILEDQEPLIAAAFIALIALMRREVNMAELEALIESGQMYEALDLVMRSAPNIATASGVAFMAAARETARQLGSADYDVTDADAVEAMRRNQLLLVERFTDGQRRATQEAIGSGIRDEISPGEQAIRFRNSIGLTATQQRAVDNYELALLAASIGALSSALRNKGYDAAVREAARTGEALSQARIKRMVEKYRNRMIAHRATVIARTEVVRAVNDGLGAMLEQAIAAGTLDRDDVIQTWHTARDERVRGTHRTMHRQKRRLGDPFVSGAGILLMRPGDSRAPASETINCRCRTTVQIRVTVAGGSES